MKDKVFIVAELSANHNHKKDIAIQTIRAAKKAGADAVKLQTYTADTITLDCRKEDFMIHGGLWDAKKKPMVISTGIATMQDIEAALDAAREAGNEDITLLRCISQYPAPVKDANLLTIPDMRQRFGVKVGLSDHSIGNTLAVVSVALGAAMVEKHFILDRGIGGPDAAFSCEPAEFAGMVQAIRQAEEALGQAYYPQEPTAIKGREFSRSLYVAEDIRKGELLTEKNIRSVRPGYGLLPRFYPEVLGRKASRDLEKGTALTWADVE